MLFIFYLLAFLSLLFSLVCVFHRNPVASSLSLILVFFCLSGIFALLDAHLIAAMQVLVYAGAIMVLFVFVIMLLNADSPSIDVLNTPRWLKFSMIAIILGLISFFSYIFYHSITPVGVGEMTAQKIDQLGGHTKAIAFLLFNEYLLPFELTSVLILIGIVCTMSLAKKDSHYEVRQPE